MAHKGTATDNAGLLAAERYMASEHARCIATDDPRLKGN